MRRRNRTKRPPHARPNYQRRRLLCETLEERRVLAGPGVDCDAIPSVDVATESRLHDQLPAPLSAAALASDSQPLTPSGFDSEPSPSPMSTAVVRGTVYVDVDRDGFRDAGEAGAVGVVVFVDANQNGARDTGEDFTTTTADDPATLTIDEAGAYEFTALAAGTFDILIETAANQIQSAPLAASTADGTLTPFDVLPATHVSGLSQPTNISISPSGNHAVATWRFGERVTSYARDPQDGRLTPIGSWATPNATLWGARDAVFSLDGNYVYVPAEYDDALNVFAIDSSGVLTIVQVVNEASLGTTDMDGIHGITISPEGSYLYATSRQAHALMVFAIDSANGQLTLIQTLKNGIDGVTGLTVPSTPIISPDGTAVIVPSTNGFASLFFDRDVATGLLTVGQANVNFGYVEHGLTTSDGRFVFLAVGDGTVRTLERDAVSGDFAQIASVSTGGVAPDRLVLSPDETALYFVSEYGNGLGTFGLDAQTGILTLGQSLSHLVEIQSLERPTGIAISNDGEHVYATGALPTRSIRCG